jgi:hypothetical protein
MCLSVSLDTSTKPEASARAEAEITSGEEHGGEMCRTEYWRKKRKR